MKAMVFGGSGFIGTHLIASIVANGGLVTVADIQPPATLLPGVEFIPCDVRTPISIPVDRQYDIVYNLAAVHRTPGHAPHEYYETNLAGAQNVFNWCSSAGVNRVVFTSSISVYGPSEEMKSESSTPAPNSDYGRSKLAAEGIHRLWRQEADNRTLVIVRPAVVFGEGEHGNFTRLAHALSHRRFFYAGRDDVVKSCGYVSDLVRAMRYLEAEPDTEVIANYCYPDRSTIGEICRAFHDVAGFDMPRTIPQRFMNSIMIALKTFNPGDRGTLSAARVTKLTASTNISPRILQQRGFEWTTDIESAIRDWQVASNGTFR